MRPNISEFSYGYALIDELIHWHGTQLTAAPVFPSLYQEGQSGGGYDAMLQRPGLPLFLQFKLSDCMVRNTAQEVKNGICSTPFYRMYIRPSRHSRQHEMLLDLENTGNEVFYSAPAFHTPEELNDAYLFHHMLDRSLWLKPSAIGSLPDDDWHHVAFQIPGTAHFCSIPRKLNTQGHFNEFTRGVEDSYHRRGEEALSLDALARTAENIEAISSKRGDISPESKRSYRYKLELRHPLAYRGDVRA